MSNMEYKIAPTKTHRLVLPTDASLEDVIAVLNALGIEHTGQDLPAEWKGGILKFVHEVDHVVPMQGESVSGLHVASNLQILTKSENSSKRNKHEDE